MRRLTAFAMAAALGGCGAIREGREAKLYEHQVQQARSQYATARTNLERCVAAKLVAVA